jgi:hypothetical protein
MNMCADEARNHDLETVLLELIDGSISEARFTALVEDLRRNAELRDRAAKFLGDEALLSEEIGATEQVAGLERLLGDRVSNDSSPDRKQGAPAILRFPLIAAINHNGLAVAAAALVAIVGLLGYNFMMMAKVNRLYELAIQGANRGEVDVVASAGPPRGASPREEPAAQGRSWEQPEVLARVIGLDQQAQADENSPYYLGRSLAAGSEVKLKSGAIELLLSTGAKVTAEGPVEFELSSLSKMQLNVGKVVAAVPRTARGYTIITPTSELVDIGTQFGVVVDDTGGTELHVFDGDVVARSLVDFASSSLLHAHEKEGLRFTHGSREPERIEARDAGFIRRLGLAAASDAIPALPITDKLALWYAADSIPELEAGDRVVLWPDLLTGDNEYANDARQLDAERAPTFAVDPFGRPVVQFNGTESTLVVDPIDYVGAYTAFIACSPGPTSFADAEFGGILFKRGKVPALELSLLNDRQLRGCVWTGSGDESVGGLASQASLRAARPAIVAYQYDSQASRSRLWVNGELRGEANAPVDLQPTAPATLGGDENPELNAHFLGGMYEVIVFDRALDDVGMQKVHQYLTDRYLNAIEEDQ